MLVAFEPLREVAGAVGRVLNVFITLSVGIAYMLLLLLLLVVYAIPPWLPRS